MRILLLVAALLSCALPTAADPLDGARQCLVVTSASWSSSTGTLQRWERVSGAWRPVGQPIPVMLGRKGMAWGRGLHPAQPGPQKREGDLRTPAGVFTLGPVFGHSGTHASKGGLPFIPIVVGTEFVDDPQSRLYNRIAQPGTPRDWKSSEHMRIPEYRIGIVVGHNPAPAVPGAGSCILLHVLTGPGVVTRGCTAMREADLRTIASWLQATAHPLLVQLPAPAHDTHRRAWSLP